MLLDSAFGNSGNVLGSYGFRDSERETNSNYPCFQCYKKETDWIVALARSQRKPFIALPSIITATVSKHWANCVQYFLCLCGSTILPLPAIDAAYNIKCSSNVSWCVCLLHWITVSVHEAPPFVLDFCLLFRNPSTEQQRWVCVWKHAASATIECYVVVAVIPFGRWLCVWALSFGCCCLLCLWCAKCDIFSHLLALRLFKCVGVFGTSKFVWRFILWIHFFWCVFFLLLKTHHTQSTIVSRCQWQLKCLLV